MPLARPDLRQKSCRSYARAQEAKPIECARFRTTIFEYSTTSIMYFVLGSIVIVFASFFGYVARQVFAGVEKPESTAEEEPQSLMRRSVS